MTDEQKALCAEVPAMQERLFRAGLIKTAQLMTPAVEKLGFEAAENVAKLKKIFNK